MGEAGELFVTTQMISTLLHIVRAEVVLTRPMGLPYLVTTGTATYTPRELSFSPLIPAKIGRGFFLSICNHLQIGSNQSLQCFSGKLSSSLPSILSTPVSQHVVQKSWGRSSRTVLGLGVGSGPQAEAPALSCQNFRSSRTHQASGPGHFLRSPVISL